MTKPTTMPPMPPITPELVEKCAQEIAECMLTLFARFPTIRAWMKEMSDSLLALARSKGVTLPVGTDGVIPFINYMKNDVSPEEFDAIIDDLDANLHDKAANAIFDRRGRFMTYCMFKLPEVYGRLKTHLQNMPEPPKVLH